MKNNHLFLLILIMFFIGSVYPLGKLATTMTPPLFLASLRVFFLFIFIIPFFNFVIPKKNFFLLLFFSLSMGFFVYATLYLALYLSTFVSPIIIGTQLAIPFGLIISKILLKEKISYKKFFYILSSFFGIIIVAYDPRFITEYLAIILIVIMAFFYALSNVLSRLLKDIDTVTQIGWHCIVGFVLLFIASCFFEGNPITNLLQINTDVLLIILHASFCVSLIGHGGIFYLYKYYPVSKILPFYSLFPIFGILLTFLIFFEIPQFYEIVGGVIVIGSVYLIHLENKKN